MKKPENMKSTTRSFNRVNQQGDENLKSDGMSNGSSQGAAKSKWAYNQHGGAAEGNFGRAAANLTGNTGRTANEGPKQPPARRLPNFEGAKKAAYNGTLNVGSQDRTPGGTRSWQPSAGQNYRGDENRINVGRGPTKGNKQ